MTAGTPTSTAAARPMISATAADDAHTEPDQLCTIHATVAMSALFSSRMAISWPFHGVGTRCVAS